MASVFIPAEPGTTAIFLNSRGGGTGFARRAVIAWEVGASVCEPVTIADAERMPSPNAVVFPDGHVEELFGVRAWPDLITYRAAMDRAARERAARA